MSGSSLEVLVILLLIVLNGVFAMGEAAVVASRKARLHQAAEEGDAKARAALDLAENPNRFLSTVQIGITLIGIFSGAFGGATLSREIAAKAATVPALAPYAPSIGLGVVVAALTYFSLVIGELVPKRLALRNPEKIAMAVAAPMRVVSTIASPLVSILAFSTDYVLRICGVRALNEPPVTEEEIKVMVEQGTQAGVFHQQEQKMVESIFRLGDRTVSSLMTRRPDIVWIDLERPLEENLSILASSAYSRLPVCRGGLDHVAGVARAKDLLAQCLEGSQIDFTVSLRDPVFVPTTQSAFKLMETLRGARTHIVFVVDEHGATQGLVTLNDLLEAIIGVLPAVDESDESYVVRREDGSWLMDGMISIEEFRHLLDLDTLPGEENGDFQTLGGFVMAQLGRIPAVADHFEAGHWRFEVMDMDGHSVDKILISEVMPGSSDSAASE